MKIQQYLKKLEELDVYKQGATPKQIASMFGKVFLPIQTIEELLREAVNENPFYTEWIIKGNIVQERIVFLNIYLRSLTILVSQHRMTDYSVITFADEAAQIAIEETYNLLYNIPNIHIHDRETPGVVPVKTQLPLL